MRGHIAAAMAGLILVAGCAAYDKDALPLAGTTYRLGIDRCNANAASFQNGSQAMECILAADRQFAVAIKLRKMAMFDAYAERMRLLAARADQRQISPDEMQKQYTEIRTDYMTAIEESQQNARDRANAFAAGMAGVGQAMEREADRQAVRNAAALSNRPLNCTSTKFGNQVNTTCN